MIAARLARISAEPWCATKFTDGDNQVWDVATTIQKPLTLKSGDRSIYVDDVAFTSDYKQLATASRDKTFRLWDAQTSRESRAL